MGFGANAGIASVNVEFASESDFSYQLGPATQYGLFEKTLTESIQTTDA